MSDIKNELSNSIFNAIFDDDDLTELEDKKVIAQKLGYELSVKAIISCELDCVEQLEKENAKLKADKAELVDIIKQLDKHYCELVDSGDAGNWNPNDEEVIKLARKLLQKHKEQNNE